MAIYWRDVGQAIIDLQLQITIITATIILLILLTCIFAIISVRLNRQPERKSSIKSTKSTVGLRLRMRHGVWQHPLHHEQHSSWWASFWQGISTEFLGAVVTTLFLGLGVLIFDQYQDIQNRKSDLILQMGSPDNATAVEAARQLTAEGWLQDGTLQGANLWGANLQGAVLQDADLRRANLWGANLQGAFLARANLQEADLANTNLQGLYLADANLQDADLWSANLQGADLTDVTLPDGSVWMLDTDITRFTNLSHPDFWDACIELEPEPWYCPD